MTISSYIVQYGCDLQVGGSDQWGNIVSGVDLIRRVEQTTVYALTQPLVVDKTTGKKFGKSEGNAVWLSAELTSPYAFYQFWLNTTDDNVIDYLKRFTFISLEEINEIEKEFTANPGSRAAQKSLAHSVTAFVHGEETAEAIKNVSALLFGEGSIEDLTDLERQLLLDNAPVTSVADGTPVVDVLVSSGLASSKREARTFIESGAIELSGSKVTDVEAIVASGAFIHSMALLKRGKKQLNVLQLQ